MGGRVSRWGFAVAAAALFTTTAPEHADACGCLSPPRPGPADSEFAVNQQSEQIIFEVEPGFVTAHVLIRYAGDPAKFAWIVPVPAVPELGLSESLTFGLLDQASQPRLNVVNKSLCPDPEYRCTQHPPPDCPGYFSPGGGGFGGTGAASSGTGGATGFSGAAGAAGASSGGGSGVTVIKKEQIGSYETVVFSATDAQKTVDWLQSEGFIVNDTMTPFMAPYIAGKMLFVASKLIPGAGAEEIKPLRMKYAANNPMIPLQLTAVAAEPHLTVTAFIFGKDSFEPVGHPVVKLDPKQLTASADGRVNYPMLVARSIDDAGRDGFVVEYDAAPPKPAFLNEPCCTGGGDNCAIGNDNVCQCPNADFDKADCEKTEGLTEAAAEYEALIAKHGRVTRLTTRISPEEMDFDPAFQPAAKANASGFLVLNGERNQLAGCEADIIDKTSYYAAEKRQSCASVYCGKGECATTPKGAGCVCDLGHVARTFTDLDGRESVTCVPGVAPVDFAKGGVLLPNACVLAQCGTGACVDVGGFPTCKCDPGTAAVQDPTSRTPVCTKIEETTTTSGARNYSAVLEDLKVCAPRPPQSCGRWGWLIANQYKQRQGEICDSSKPKYDTLLTPPKKPTCEEYYGPRPGGGTGATGTKPPSDAIEAAGGGCALSQSSGRTEALGVLLLSMFGFGWRRRRRQPR